MTKQLTLTGNLIVVDGARQWRIDDRTREIGRRGIADARRTLRDRAPVPLPSPDEHHHLEHTLAA